MSKNRANFSRKIENSIACEGFVDFLGLILGPAAMLGKLVHPPTRGGPERKAEIEPIDLSKRSFLLQRIK